MSDASTTRMIEAYLEEAEAPLFLAGHFRSPPENFHDTEKVEVDVQRDDEEVAIVLEDAATGARLNTNDLYTNKGFTPPVYDEAGAITAYNLMRRDPGDDPFKNPDFGLKALRQAFGIFRKLERKIRRAIEWQAAQVLSTGQLALLDQTGATKYTLSFSPKATHFVTTGTAWALDGSTGDPLGDLESLATVIRRDGKKIPNHLIFGTSAFQRFKANAKVLAAFDKTVLNIASMAPATRGMGATFQGYVWIGHYRFEMWTYDGFFKHPQTGTLTPYVATDHVLMLSEGARLDLTFGTIPMFVQPDQRVMSFLPPRISGQDKGVDLTTNAWVTPDGKSLMVSAGTRPLTIPTAIDTFGRIDVQP